MIEIKIRNDDINITRYDGEIKTVLVDGKITKFEQFYVNTFPPREIIIRVSESETPADGRYWSSEVGYINFSDGVGISDNGVKIDYARGEAVRLLKIRRK